MHSLSAQQQTDFHQNETYARLKVVLIGNPSVGKTSIRRVYTGKDFRETYVPTLGADFAQITTNINNITANIAIWDLSGQQRFKKSHPQYFIGSHAAIVVYDVESSKPLENIIEWINRYIEYSGNTSEPILVLQNKIDLLNPTDEIQAISDHEQLIERLNIYYHRRLKILGERTSAKTNENIQSSLDHLFQLTLDHYNLNSTSQVDLNNQIENGLYCKSAYLMSFDEEHGPIIVSKSPNQFNSDYNPQEISQCVRLYSVLDFDFLIKEGFRFGLAPWSSEDAGMYYVAFTVPNDQIRGGYNMFILGVSIGKDLSNLLAGSHDRIEGVLLNAMNTISDSLQNFSTEITFNENILSVIKTSIDPTRLNKALYRLRVNVDRIIRELLFD